MITVLQISMSLLISLAGVIFACAEGGPLAAVTVLIAIASLLFVDWDNVISIGTVTATILGTLGFLVAAMELLFGGIEGPLLAGGHLLSYLAWVFLLQRKDGRHYIWIFAISILLIALAAVLTTEMWFGFAILVYTLLAIWTLSVFHLYQALHWSLGSQASSKKPSSLGQFRRGLARDVNEDLLNSRFVGSTLVVTAISLFVSGLFFMLTPRVWIGEYTIFGDTPISGAPLTGFTDEVRLGDMGEILENSDPVLMLKLYHAESNFAFREDEYETYLGPEPLFRGACLEFYEDGRWYRLNSPLPAVPARSNATADVRQEYRLQPIGTPTLFSFGDAVAVDRKSRGGAAVRMPLSNEFLRTWRARSETEYITLANHAPPDTYFSQERLTWPQNPRRFYQEGFSGRVTQQEALLAYLESLTEIPDGMEPVAELAASICEGATSREEIVTRLYEHLQDPDQYSYSLKLDIQDPTVDPLVDFLINRKSGHCEYFASAMAMMLRTMQIPARIASGFKGGTLDTDRLEFTVQQLHAHTWVEAFVHGQWQTIDPTPEDRNVIVAEQQAQSWTWQNAWERSRDFWQRGVRFSQSEQQRTIYGPIQDSFRDIWDVSVEVYQGNTSALREIWDFVRSPRRWFSVEGGLVAFILMLLASGCVWVLRRLWRLINASQKRRQQLQQRKIVEFFERLTKLLARRGLSRQESQTAREFVSTAIIELKPVLRPEFDSQQLHTLIDKFYLVRFGEGSLTLDESRRIDQVLQTLEEDLSRGQAGKETA